MDRVELSVDAGSMHAVSRQRPQSPEGGLRSPPHYKPSHVTVYTLRVRASLDYSCLTGRVSHMILCRLA